MLKSDQDFKDFLELVAGVGVLNEEVYVISIGINEFFAVRKGCPG